MSKNGNENYRAFKYDKSVSPKKPEYPEPDGEYARRRRAIEKAKELKKIEETFKLNYF